MSFFPKIVRDADGVISTPSYICSDTVNTGNALYMKGDYEKAIEYFNKAISEEKSADAMYLMGNYCHSILKNDMNACSYWNSAITAGSIMAMIALGNYYSSFNLELAKKYLFMAVNSGEPYAYYMLVKNVFYKQHLLYDIKHYLQLAINSGVIEAIYELAVFYKRNEPNPELYLKYLHMAADNGDVFAYYKLAKYHYNVTHNLGEMKKYLELGMNAGETQCALMLANHYQFVEYNMEKRHDCYLIAIKNGCQEALYRMINFHHSETHNYDVMMDYYNMFFESNYRTKWYDMAMINYGYYCRYTSKNYDEMKRVWWPQVKKNNIDILHSLLDYYISVSDDSAIKLCREYIADFIANHTINVHTIPA